MFVYIVLLKEATKKKALLRMTDATIRFLVAILITVFLHTWRPLMSLYDFIADFLLLEASS